MSASDGLDEQIAGIAALDEPVRRDLYRYLSEQGREVSRDEAAEALGIGRPLAAFHLDRLAAEGMVDVTFRRLSGRRGPGAGRPSKLYRRSTRQVDVTLPPRRYELAARLMAATLASADSPETEAVLHEVAHGFGEELGIAAQEAADRDAEPLIQTGEAALVACGYEPCRGADGAIHLRNCPFHALAEEHRPLVCGMNLAIMEGFADGLGAPLRPELNPQPGMCCVTLWNDADTTVPADSREKLPSSR